MKTVAIIYAVSIILVFLMLLVNKNRSTFIRRNNSLQSKQKTAASYLIIFILAPLFVILLPFILVKNEGQRTKSERRNKDYAIRENERKELIDKSLKQYSESSKHCDNVCSQLFINCAHSLQEAVEQRMFSRIALILDKMELPKGSQLEVKESNDDVFGASKLSVADKYVGEDIFKVIKFENSEMGAWQAYLLHQIGFYLPLRRHALNTHRIYIYADSDLIKVSSLLSTEIDSQRFKESSVNPIVFFDGEHFFISCCYWSFSSGLIREYVEVRIKDGYIVNFNVFKQEVIYEYHSNIRFI